MFMFHSLSTLRDTLLIMSQLRFSNSSFATRVFPVFFLYIILFNLFKYTFKTTSSYPFIARSFTNKKQSQSRLSTHFELVLKISKTSPSFPKTSYIFDYLEKYEDHLINILARFDFHLRYNEFIFGKYLHFASFRFTPLVSAYMAIIMCPDRAGMRWGGMFYFTIIYLNLATMGCQKRDDTDTSTPPNAPRGRENRYRINANCLAGRTLAQQFSTMIMSF